jgi:hypothetical protein
MAVALVARHFPVFAMRFLACLILRTVSTHFITHAFLCFVRIAGLFEFIAI